MLLLHPDGSVEKTDVTEMRPHGRQWSLAADEMLGIRWNYPQPPMLDHETGYLFAGWESVGEQPNGGWRSPPWA